MMSSSLNNGNITSYGVPWDDPNMIILLYVLVSTVGGILIVWSCLCLGTVIVGIALYTRQSRSKTNETHKSLLRLESKSPRQSDGIKIPNSMEGSETSKEDK